MSELPRDVPNLIRYLDTAIDGPKDGKTLSEAVCYLKESIVVLVQTDEWKTDEWKTDEQQSEELHGRLATFVDIIAKALEKGDKVEKLEKQVQELKKQLNSPILLAGQVASKLEREIVKITVEGTDLNEEDIPLTFLFDAMRNNPDRMSQQGLDASKSALETIRRNFKSFEKNFNTEIKMIFQGIMKFKKDRNKIAHPQKTLEEALECLRNSHYKDKDKELIRYMLEILRRLQVAHI